MKKIIIIGAGGHARAVLSTLSLINDCSAAAIIDLNYTGANELILDIPVVGGFSKLQEFSPLQYTVFLAIGDNRLRKNVEERISPFRFNYPSIVHPRSLICPSATVAEGCYLGPNSHIGPYASVGRHSIVNTMASVEHEVLIGDFSHIAPGSVICGRCTLGSSVFCGANSTIIENLSVADSTFLAAGTVVVSDVTPQGLRLKGVPGTAF
jgi:sugar O-acyltransferase (sialic acid O-acetyltransferase NeuD family)